jgi:hypothetical protein
MSSNAPLSPHAVYHSVPQLDTAIESSDIELDREDAVFDQPSNSAASVDTRIRWIYFMFGSALLLPWNGDALFCKFECQDIDTSFIQLSLQPLLTFFLEWLALHMNQRLVPTSRHRLRLLVLLF